MKPLYENFTVVAQKIVESNLEDESFGCPELCDELRMSRSQIHRKLKAETNLSTSDFIKHIRLEKAKEMLLMVFIRLLVGQQYLQTELRLMLRM